MNIKKPEDYSDFESSWMLESFVEEHLPELPRSEFPSVTFDPEKNERVEINPGSFFEGDSVWDFDPTEEELNEIEGAFHQGPPGYSESQNSWRPVHWETCAWYQPVHFFGPNWGIYIKESCIFSTAKRFARFVPRYLQVARTSREWFNVLSLAATWVYYLHEHYHHRVESFGIRLHVVMGHSKYVPYENQVYGVLKSNLGNFPKGPYINGWDPDEQIEEALANANSYNQIGSQTYSKKLGKQVVNIVREALRWEFRYDPPGYRQAVHYLNRESFKHGESLLQTRVVLADLSPVATHSWSFAPGMTKGFYGNRSKFWAVVDRAGRCRLPKI